MCVKALQPLSEKIEAYQNSSKNPGAWREPQVPSTHRGSSENQNLARPSRSLQSCCTGIHMDMEYPVPPHDSISTLPAYNRSPVIITGKRGIWCVHSASRHEIGTDLVISQKLAASAAVYRKCNHAKRNLS